MGPVPLVQAMSQLSLSAKMERRPTGVMRTSTPITRGNSRIPRRKLRNYWSIKARQNP